VVLVGLGVAGDGLGVDVGLTLGGKELLEPEGGAGLDVGGGPDANPSGRWLLGAVSAPQPTRASTTAGTSINRELQRRRLLLRAVPP
jgi:hypothetical protein